MAGNFDDFSKHLAKRQSRRGVLRFFGASMIGALTATIFSRTTEASPGKRPNEIAFNQTRTHVFGTPGFNHLISNPAFNATFNATNSH